MQMVGSGGRSQWLRVLEVVPSLSRSCKWNDLWTGSRVVSLAKLFIGFAAGSRRSILKFDHARASLFGDESPGGNKDGRPKEPHHKGAAAFSIVWKNRCGVPVAFYLAECLRTVG
jgi:hypothetical protein